MNIPMRSTVSLEVKNILDDLKNKIYDMNKIIDYRKKLQTLNMNCVMEENRVNSIVKMAIYSMKREDRGSYYEFNNSAYKKKITIFIGDLHGNLKSFNSIYDDHEQDALYVFTGDISDRGNKSLELWMLIISLKLIHNCIILTRGNHEEKGQQFNGCGHNLSDFIMKQYYDEKSLTEQDYAFGHDYTIVNSFITMFAYIPLVNYLKDIGLLVLHGGIPIGLKKLKDLHKLTKYSEEITIYNNVNSFQILWNDPYPILKNKRFIRNFYRNNHGYLYGTKVMETLYKHNPGIVAVIRGHSHFILKEKGYTNTPMNGYQILEGRIVTLFSSKNYENYNNNLGGYMSYDSSAKKIYLHKF